MRGKKPEDRLWRIWVVLTGLALGSCAVGAWIAQGILAEAQDRAELVWTEALAFESRSVTEGLLENIRTLRRSALNATLSEGVVHWLEVEWHEGEAPRIVKAMKNAGYEQEFPAPLERSYLAGVLRKFDFRKVDRANESQALRYRKDPLQPLEWLVFGFRDGVPTGAPRRFYLVLVDPARAFSAYRLSEQAKKSQNRRYLVTSDGRVLTHSHEAYDAADFGDTEVFKKIRAEGESGVISGVVSLDQQLVRAAFSRLPGLPVISVVERVMNEPAEGYFGHFGWRRLAGASLIGMGLLAGLIGLGGAILGGFRRSVK